MTRIIKRKSKSTGGIFCGEGFHECDFIDLLKEYYGVKGCLPRTENCYGGSPNSITNHAIRMTYNRSDNHKALILDSDHPLSNSDRKILEKAGYKIFESNICWDAEILRIIIKPTSKRLIKQYKTCTNSQAYKDLLHNEFLGGRERVDTNDLKRILPKTLLDKNRSNNIWLDNCIKFIETDCLISD